MRKQDDHLPGSSPSDLGDPERVLEGSIQTFEEGRPSSLDDPAQPEELHGVQGPGGDSRPDPPGNPGWVAADEDRPDLVRGHGPEVTHENPETLEHQRVDEIDEIVPRPLGPLDDEGNVLRPNVSTQGGVSEEL